ncbi:hypothetical protein HDF19_06130 [Mucilaginibacter sp. E4BP6]|uniref:hypothetical protein n=1 Tax=Mucilaginibacter sp. E4BP6 TaxID=2723089 RepID=UPI0015CA8F02|nr:hypothetical protein [Mucilaginibacter sp. E4BP6]NYE68387.1 hypothetical protein [Mucilaginibacter sp. E4BP6]
MVRPHRSSANPKPSHKAIMLNSRSTLPPDNPHAHGGHLFNWGLSSKAPNPPLERLRAGCKPHGQPTTHAYIQPENVSLFLSTTFADHREQRQVCHEPTCIVVVLWTQKHKLAAYRLIALSAYSCIAA